MTGVRYALRSLIRAPWFSTAAVMTFAVGMGLNVAVFSIVDKVLFRPPPYDYSELWLPASRASRLDPAEVLRSQ